MAINKSVRILRIFKEGALFSTVTKIWATKYVLTDVD